MNHAKVSRNIWILLLLVSCVVLFVGCFGASSGGETVSQISFADNEKPQDTYAVGQELNLAKGKMVVTRNDGTKETVALNAEGVSVSGYDPNKLGQQTVTVSYAGQTASFTVNVIKRMVFTGHETEYFVGDNFKTDKGKVTILKDDGTRLTVELDDSAISVVDFDSSAAGTGKQVTIRYSANNVEYTDTVAVNVYDVGGIKFMKPSKYAYGNHETAVNLNGGYFTVTALGNNGLTKHIELQQDMVTGFDPSVATKENMDTPMVQTLTVSYLGQSYQFDIHIRYSGVSLMRDAAELVKNINFADPENLEILTEQGEAAVEALRVFMQMTPADRDALEQETADLVARVGGIYSVAYYAELSEPFGKALVVDGSSMDLMSNCTYADVAAAIDYLSDADNEFLQFCDYMEAFMEEYGDLPLFGVQTIRRAIGYVTRENVESALQVLKFLKTIHDDLAPVPEKWTEADLAQHGKTIEAAARHIRNFENPALVMKLCSVVSAWRAKNDYIEILYTYYYSHQPSLLVEDLWGRIPLPGKLQMLYDYIVQASTVLQTVEAMGAQSLWYDLVNFHYYCTMCEKTTEEIMTGTDELSKKLYAFIDFDSLQENYLLYSSMGYLNLTGPLYGDPEYAQLLQDFMGIYIQAVKQYGQVDLDENQALLQSIFDRFSALTPAKQRAFLSSLYYNYGREEVYDSMLMDYAEGTANGTFVYLMVAYFRQYLPESTHAMLQDLLLAMEYYMNNSLYADALSNFDAKMESLRAAYQTLSQEDQAAFDQYLGKTYRKYLRLHEIQKNGVSVDQQSYQPLFQEMVQAIRDFGIMYSNLANVETGGLNEGMMAATIAAYERASLLAKQIQALGNDEIMALFYTQIMDFTEENRMPLDTALMNLRWNFIVLMHRTTYSITDSEGASRSYFAWDFYRSGALSEFLGEAFGMMKLQYQGSTAFDAAKIQMLMRMFRENILQDPTAITAFYTFDGDYFYYGGLRSFFTKVLTAENLALAEKLLEAERWLCNYRTAATEEEKAACLASFEAVMAEAVNLYGAVTNTENFETYLSEMYRFYGRLSSQMQTAA